MIETDGVSCSIVLILKDKVGNIAKAKKGGSEPYIDDLTSEERAGLSGKKMVGIDPNMGDLLYCVDSDQRDQKLFRYSQDTRRKETKLKKYRDHSNIPLHSAVTGWDMGRLVYLVPLRHFQKMKQNLLPCGVIFFTVWGQFSLLKSDGTLPVALELCDAHIFFPLHIPQHICHLLEFFENYLSSSFTSCVFYLPDSFF